LSVLTLYKSEDKYPESLNAYAVSSKLMALAVSIPSISSASEGKLKLYEKIVKKDKIKTPPALLKRKKSLIDDK
jgi:hypothetical protein